jgi:hypothetical protein
MADLTWPEKRKLEELFGMESGYVLDFSNRSFAEFFSDVARREIMDSTYERSGTSKANRLRTFWAIEPNHLVGKVLTALIEHAQHKVPPEHRVLCEECKQIAVRLAQGSPLEGLEALTADPVPDFEVIAGQVRDVIEKNQPEAGLDRLHTFTTKFVRNLCERHGLTPTRDKPLHSVYGEYVKKVREEGHVESEMGVRILKSSIAILDAFNDVRNNRSLAHDNAVLNRDESMLIFNHVAATVRFLRDLEARIDREKEAARPPSLGDDEIPF